MQASNGTYVVKYPVSGALSAAIADTGLSAGTQIYRVVARITTNAPAAGATSILGLTGKVEVSVS